MQIPTDELRTLSNTLWQFLKQRENVPENDDAFWTSSLAALDDIIEAYEDPILRNYALEYGTLLLRTLNEFLKREYGKESKHAEVQNRV